MLNKKRETLTSIPLKQAVIKFVYTIKENEITTRFRETLSYFHVNFTIRPT